MKTCRRATTALMLRTMYLTVVVSLSWILLVVSDCAQHTITGWMYRAIDGQRSAVWRSLSLDRPSGIYFQTSLEKRPKTLSGCH